MNFSSSPSAHYVLPTNHESFSFCFPWRCFSSSFQFWFSFQILVKRMSNRHLHFQFLFCSHLNIQPSIIFYWISSYMLCAFFSYIKGGSKLKLLNMLLFGQNIEIKIWVCIFLKFLNKICRLWLWTIFKYKFFKKELYERLG